MSQIPDPVPPTSAAAPLGYAPTPASTGVFSATAYAGPAPAKDDQNMALLCYILAIFTGFVGPLIIWLVKKDSSPFVADQGKEVLNWSITMAIIYIMGFVLSFILIGFFVIPAALVCNLVFNILGAVKVSKGEAYRYPFALRLIK